MAVVHWADVLRVAPLLAVLALLVPAPALARGLTTGIADPLAFKTGLQTPAIGAASDQATSVGARTVRLQLTWKSVETAPGVYNWGTAFDRVVDAVRARGLDPMVFVMDAPPWAERSGTGLTPGTRDPNPKMLGRFARAAARHFKGRVRFWEVWNEPNGIYWLSPQYKHGRPYSPKLYRSMVNHFASAVHGVDRRNVVVAGGTQPFGHGKNVIAPLTFMRKMLCLNDRLKVSCRQKSQFDVWTTHPYTYGAPTRHARSKNDVSIGDLPQMKRVLKAATRHGRIVNRSGRAKRKASFWVSEISWDTWRPDPNAPPTKLQARWVSLGVYRMWRSGVSRIYWFMIKDQPLSSSLWQSGFYDVGGARKAYSAQAFRFPFVAFAHHRRVSVWGRIPPGVRARSVVIERHTSGGWRRVTRARVHGGVFGKRWRSGLRHGALRATAGGESSLGFALQRRESRRSFYPFGCGGDIPCQ